MGTLNEDLTEIKRVEDTLTKNKVSRFAYTEEAYKKDLADGVPAYNVNNGQNIPIGTADIMKVNQTVIDRGYRAQASSITRMLLNHFLGRLSYNLNKVNDNVSSLLATLQSHLGKANGIASLDENGRVPYSQLPESAMELKGEWDASTNTPELVDGTGTNGDFYVVTVAGTQTFGGKSIKFQVNDRILYNGSTSTWIKLQAGGVYSVCRRTPDTDGNVTIYPEDIKAITNINGKLAEYPLGNPTAGYVTLTAKDVEAVAKINNISPDSYSNVTLSATDVGAVASVNNSFPDKYGNVVLDALSVDAVKTVNSKSPDEESNVNLVATDLPALKTVNGKSATSTSDEITLSATDVGAVATVNGESPDSAGNVKLTGSQIDISDVNTTKLSILDSFEMHNMIYGGRDMTNILSQVLAGDVDAYKSIFPGDYFSVYQNTTLNTLVFMGFNFKVNVRAVPIFALTNKSSVISNIPWASSAGYTAIQNGYMGSNLYNIADSILSTIKTLQGLSFDNYIGKPFSLYLSSKTDSDGNVISFIEDDGTKAFFPSIIDIFGETYMHRLTEGGGNKSEIISKIQTNTCLAGNSSGQKQLPAFKLNYYRTFNKLKGEGSPVYTRDFVFNKSNSNSNPFSLIFHFVDVSTPKMLYVPANQSAQMMILFEGKEMNLM